MNNTACVWQKRFFDNSVLVSTECVQPIKCYVFFAADSNYPNLYSYDGVKVMESCSIQKNGKGTVYIIPMSWLNDEGPLPVKYNQIKESEYKKYQKYKQKNLKSINN